MRKKRGPRRVAFLVGLVLSCCAVVSASSSGLSPEEGVEALLSQMTLEEKIHQLFFVTPESIARERSTTKVTPELEAGLARCPVGGIVVLPGNIKGENQLAHLLQGMQQTAQAKHGIGLFLGVDEEGGGVSRVANMLQLSQKQPVPGDIGKTGDPTQAFASGQVIGTYLAKYGFNLNFAPVADVRTELKDTEIGSRAYSDDPKLAAAMVGQFVQGLQGQGIMATLKHFPGHGSAVGNSHNGPSISTRSLQQWREAEWLPFQAGLDAKAPFVLVSHLTAAIVDPGHPASLSPRIVTELLRKELGFTGVIMTDALRMDSISREYSSGEACVLALEAGVDMLLMPKNYSNAVRGVQKALGDGRLTEQRIDESVRRILLVKWQHGLISP